MLKGIHAGAEHTLQNLKFLPAMLEWKDEYNCGIALIDAQHKSLFDKINELEEIANAPTIDTERLDPFIDFLESYVLYHFEHEELCMARFNCPMHETNMRAHRKFVEVWGAFRIEYADQGAKRELLQKILFAAQAWIKQHICKVDTALKDAVDLNTLSES